MEKIIVTDQHLELNQNVHSKKIKTYLLLTKEGFVMEDSFAKEFSYETIKKIVKPGQQIMPIYTATEK